MTDASPFVQPAGEQSIDNSPPPVPPRSSMLTVLRNRDVLLLWLGEAISLIGDQFYLVVLPFLALELSGGSGLALGLALMLAGIPRALLILVGGAVTDRFSPRTVMLVSNALRGVLVAIMATLLAGDMAQLWHVYVISFFFGIVDAFFYPAHGAMLPRLVERQDLEAGNALMQITMRGSLVVGPALAGIVIAAGGKTTALILDALTFAASVFTLYFINDAPPRKKRKNADITTPDHDADSDSNNGIVASIMEGVRHVRADKLLLAGLLMVMVVDFSFVGPISVGLPVLSDTRFAEGASAFAMMMSGFGAGSLIGLLIASSWKPQYLGRFFIGVMVIFAMTIGAIAFAESSTAVALMMAIAGAGSGLYNVLGVSWLQRRTPDAMMGRIMSLLMFSSVGLAPLSNAIAGVMVDVSIEALFLGAAGLVLVAAVMLATRRDFRNLLND